MAHYVIPENTEWQECRSTIGRLDTNLVDLRKYSFTVITALITASGFLGGQQSPSALTKDAVTTAVSATIMVLIVALFAVDRFYVVVQAAAVERALDIEGPEIDAHEMTKNQLTQVISVAASNLKSVYVIPVLYNLLLFATLILAFGKLGRSSDLIVGGFFGVGLVLIWGYFGFSEWKYKTASWRPDRFGSSRR